MRFFPGLLFILTAVIIHAQPARLDSLFGHRPEVCFAFAHPGEAILADLSRHISLDHGSRADTLFAYADRLGFAYFLEKDLPHRLLREPNLEVGRTRGLADRAAKAGPCQETIDFYPSYELYETMMTDFAAAFPGICRLEEIGVLPSGRRLLAVVISDNVATEEAEPRFLYTATMHGNETTGFPLMLRLIDHLLCHYGQDDRLTALVDEVEIWINPLANPDGTYTDDNGSLVGATRFNANGVDLNRNYPDPEDGPHPDGNPWQPETLSFLALADAHPFHLSANLHGGVEVCNYPWDTWAQLHADDDWWRYVTRQYADTAQLHGPPGYFNDFDDGITNGYQWYTVAGGRQDFTTYFHRGREFTLELSDTKKPPASELDAFWLANYRSLLNYLEQARFGLRGVVTDSLTGEPLSALVRVEGHDQDSSHVRSRLPQGDYYRFLKAGSYTLTFSAPGYVPRTIPGLTVADQAATVLDVALVPEGVTAVGGPSAPAGFSLESVRCEAGVLDLRWRAREGGTLHLRLFDAAGRPVGERKVTTAAGAGRERWALPALAGGIYFLRCGLGGVWRTEKVWVE